MSKAHRGKGIRDQFARGRGECPICKRDNVKTLYEKEVGELKLKICKTCKAALASGKKEIPAGLVPPAPPPAPEEKAAPAAEAPAEETAAEPVAE